MTKKSKPIVIITGASGNIGAALTNALKNNYKIIGMDIKPSPDADISIECDLTSDESVQETFKTIKNDHGKKIATIIHLAAYFDFTGDTHPMYEKVNIEGTRRLINELQSFQVDRFIYSSTMLVQEATKPGKTIDENGPVNPKWAYPKSKAEAEKVIRKNSKDIPYTILRLAGLYDDSTAVPTLSHQISRIYERDPHSYAYSGDLDAGQAFIHQDDMINLFTRVVERRKDLPAENIILAGEEEVLGYQDLQNRIGKLIHGEEEWMTIALPEPIAKAGSWAENHAEPIIPDSLDKGEKPFIKPFMIDLASDHYALDISRAKQLLDWQPEHNIYNGLQKLIKNLKANPAAWYEKNNITPPDSIAAAEETGENPEILKETHESKYRLLHSQNIWAHFLNIALAFWMLSAPFILSYESEAMIWSDMIAGIALLVFASLSLSWRLGIMRWASAAVGFWILAAPLIFWAPTAAAYLNSTIIGALVLGLAVCTRPAPGVSFLAAETGGNVPRGWTFSPSAWFQRLPIIFLAFIGFYISRYMCAYQLGHIDTIWDPFFSGSAEDPQNGTGEIITSSVSKAFPVPDAGLGGLVYALEILTGIVGSSRRWRTMPWLVMAFGIMIVPLGAVSIFFIIIQPIMLGTWCTLCLIAAAAMLIQIPYSLDELIATSEFLYRRKKQGRPLLRIFFTGDTDKETRHEKENNFEQTPFTIIKNMFTGGVTLPWNLALCIPIGIWLMFTRLTLGSDNGMANADHIIGSLVLTVTITALAELGRAIRYLLIPLGMALFMTPFVFNVSVMAIVSSLICGVLLIGLSLPKGKIHNTYGVWNKAVF